MVKNLLKEHKKIMAHYVHCNIGKSQTDPDLRDYLAIRKEEKWKRIEKKLRKGERESDGVCVKTVIVRERK